MHLERECGYAAHNRRLRGDGRDVVVFGKHWGKELRLPSRISGGGYFVDWILARLDPTRSLAEFVAIELQTMDTTGSYEAQGASFFADGHLAPDKQSNINWEKRLEAAFYRKSFSKAMSCGKNHFVGKACISSAPTPVYEKNPWPLGGNLRPYHPQPGALTFRQYDVGGPVAAGKMRALEFKGR